MQSWKRKTGRRGSGKGGRVGAVKIQIWIKRVIGLSAVRKEWNEKVKL